MAGPFDISGFIDDAKKNIGQAADGVLKNAGDIAHGAAEAVRDTAEGAANAIADTVNNTVEAAKEVTRPKPQYCNNTSHLDASPCVLSKTIIVKRIREDAEGKPIEGYEQVLRMSSAGIELLANAVAHSQEANVGLFIRKRIAKSSTSSSSVEVVANIRVRNCSMLKKGTTGGSNPLERAAAGAIAGGSIVGSLNILTVPIGAVGGAIVGLVAPSGAKDIWYLDILDYNNKEWAFRLQSKENGEEVLEFLDAYFHL